MVTETVWDSLTQRQSHSERPLLASLDLVFFSKRLNSIRYRRDGTGNRSKQKSRSVTGKYLIININYL